MIQPWAVVPEPVFTWQTVEFLPVVHGVMEFAVVVRQVLTTRRFAHVVVELPPTIKTPVMDAVRRLPVISVVHYETAAGRVHVLVEPTAPLFEAIRTALEQRISVHFADLDVEGDGGAVVNALPDIYALTRIGYAAFCRSYVDTVKQGRRRTAEAVDRRREEAMAYGLQQAARQKAPVLCVCGLDHVQGLLELLQKPVVQPLGRVHRKGVKISHLNAESSREVAAEPAYIRHAYQLWRQRYTADNGAETRRGHDGSAESAATDDGCGPVPVSMEKVDRLKAQRALWLKARVEHLEDTEENVSVDALATAVRFARNWALLEGRLVPDVYQLVVAARGVANDDFAYRVWDLATRAPEQEVSYDMAEIQLTPADLGQASRLLRFRKRIRQRRRLPRAIRKKKKPDYPGQWKEGWRPGAICSYPPEDIIIEGYGQRLKKQAHRMFLGTAERIEPFTVSLGDGIDVRETIRNWHEGRIYVKHRQAMRSKVGAVIVIFDPDDRGREKYPWKLTWQGEHQQESDMAFYATPVGHRLVGPGIARSEYGGFLMTYPPGRMFHVWQDPFFDGAQTKPQRLLLAALDYCGEEMIVYVGGEPPPRRYRMLASRFGKKLIYIPLGQLAPDDINRIRHFHILAGHRVRDYAGEYID